MKKVSKAILLPLLCIAFGSLSSCSSKDERVKLTYGEVTHQETHEITYARLESMISNKESFLLVVDPKGCACYNTFIKASEDYIKEHHLVLYKMSVADFKNNETHGIKVVEGSTSFTIFNQGAVQQSIASNSSTDVMSNQSKFVEYIEKYIKFPNMYLVKKENLDTMYHQSNKFMIYFARYKCGDCSSINKDFLYEYMRNRDEIMYVFDGDEEIRRYNDNGDLINEDEWNIFKENYGLASVHNPAYDGQAEIINPTYGYGAGFVPTFFVVNGTQDEVTFHSGAVAYNDTVEKIGNEYKITESYYSSERQSVLSYASSFEVIQGKTLSESDVVEYKGNYYWNQSSSKSVYIPRIQAFLDTYLSQMTYQF